MWEALPDAVASLDSDDGVRVIILRGAGDEAFAAGADIAEFAGMGDDVAAMAAFEEKFERAQASLENASKPVIAAIRGPCMGGGLALALACDMRIAGDDAKLAIPAARLSLGYAAPAVARLMQVAGKATAFEVLATARRYDAQGAKAAGLVNEVVPAADVFARAAEVARTIAANAPLTVQAAKATVNALVQGGEALQEAEAMIARCTQSADYAEGRRAFMEKREPKFEGR